MKIEINQSMEWRMVLAYLEEQKPEYLAQMLRSGTLESYLTEKVKAAWATGKELRKQGRLKDDQIEEIKRHYLIAPPDPNYHPEDQKELPEDAKKLLEQFKAKQQPIE